MARWCLRLDRALSDDERWNYGCTDEWGTHHKCEGCPHNRYMGDGSGWTASAELIMPDIKIDQEDRARHELYNKKVY